MNQKFDIFKLSLAFHLPLDLKGEAVNGRQPFIATITYAGMPSDGPVTGTEDMPGGPYRVLIPTDLMTPKIQDLIGKGVFAALSLDTHAGTTRIGKYTDAWTKQFPQTNVEAVCASGFLDWSQSKEIVAKVVERARKSELGFSYDLKNATAVVEDFNGTMVATLQDFEWRGATIVYRQAAAYQMTDLAARFSGRSAISVPGIDLNPNSNRSLEPSASSASSTAGNSSEHKEIDLTPEEIRTIFAESLKPFTDAQKTFGEQLGGIDTRLKTVEAKQVAPAGPTLVAADGNKVVLDAITKLSTRIDGIEAKAPAAAPAAAVAGETLTIKDLAAAVATAVGTKFEEVMKTFVPAKPGTGKRATFSAEAVETIKRHATFEGDEPTMENIQASIAAVTDNKSLTRSQKESTLNVLSAMKRDLRRSAAAGGAN